MTRLLVLLASSALLVSCAKQQTAARPKFSGPPKAYQLVPAAEEKETEQRSEKREDLYVSTESGNPIPVVVTTSEVGPISLQGGRAKLYGDEGGTAGWSVDNFLLLEVLDNNNSVIDRMAIGFQGGTTMGAETIDALGGMKFSFEPGEIDITRKLPSDEPFKLRATVLDVGGVGKISDVFLVISADASGSSEQDDLRYE